MNVGCLVAGMRAVSLEGGKTSKRILNSMQAGLTSLHAPDGLRVAWIVCDFFRETSRPPRWSGRDVSNDVAHLVGFLKEICGTRTRVQPMVEGLMRLHRRPKEYHPISVVRNMIGGLRKVHGVKAGSRISMLDRQLKAFDSGEVEVINPAEALRDAAAFSKTSP